MRPLILNRLYAFEREHGELDRSRNRCHAIRIVIPHAVDTGGDFVGDHLVGWVWLQYIRSATFTQPIAVVSPIQYHRHPVVDGFSQFVRGRGDDRECFDSIARFMVSAIIVRRPDAPDACERKRTLIGHANSEWLSPAILALLPLIEPVGGN